MNASGPAAIDADYFDGVSARGRRVRLAVEPGGLHIRGEAIDRLVPLRRLRWPERTRHGARVTHLDDGASLQALNPAAWDAWAREARLGESLVVRAQQNWRSTLAAVVLLLALGAAGYQWGVPWAARATLALVPLSADRAVGDAVWSSMELAWLAPSRVPPARQHQLRAALAAAVEKAYPPDRRPHYELRFQAGKKDAAAGGLGRNAFALPGGVIVISDELLELLQGRDDVVLGVLGHELGHVAQRHGMRQLLQAGLIGTATSLAWGDFSAVLAAVPVMLGHAGYSRDMEREADDAAIALLRANAISPAVMVTLFERLSSSPGGSDGPALSDALASHPADAERIQRFREAATNR